MNTDSAPNRLSSFLGTVRWQRLFKALRREQAGFAKPSTNSFAVIASMAVATVPLLTAGFSEEPGQPSLPLLGLGVATVLAVLIRWRTFVPFVHVQAWKESMDLTHTAFALGCIPAVATLFFFPDLLADRAALFAGAAPGQEGPPLSLAEWGFILALVFAASAWAAVTEEVLFRGLVVAVLRRWQRLQTQRMRDVFAVLLSSVLFGAAHYPMWGFGAALALFFLGIGFGVGYIANGERVTPLIVYHFAFDVLSILAAVFAGSSL